MSKTIYCTFLLIFLPFITNAQSEKYNIHRPDGIAPIGVTSAHFHHKGDWMLSYRYMQTKSDGYLWNNEEIHIRDVLRMYDKANSERQVQTHMLGIMYAPSNRINLMLMGNYHFKDMSMTYSHYESHEMNLNGIGDISITGMYKAFDQNRHSIHALFGLSNISLTSSQMSSETLDPLLGFNYLVQFDHASLGLQSIYTYRFNNYERYKKGNSFKATAWAAFQISQSFSIFARGNYMLERPLDRSTHPQFMEENRFFIAAQQMAPENNIENTGYNVFDLSFGANYRIPKGSLEDLYLGLEVGYPIHQDLEGVQMEHSLSGTIGIFYMID